MKKINFFLLQKSMITINDRENKLNSYIIINKLIVPQKIPTILFLCTFTTHSVMMVLQLPFFFFSFFLCDLPTSCKVNVCQKEKVSFLPINPVVKCVKIDLGTLCCSVFAVHAQTGHDGLMQRVIFLTYMYKVKEESYLQSSLLNMIF